MFDKIVIIALILIVLGLGFWLGKGKKRIEDLEHRSLHDLGEDWTERLQRIKEEEERLNQRVEQMTLQEKAASEKLMSLDAEKFRRIEEYNALLDKKAALNEEINQVEADKRRLGDELVELVKNQTRLNLELSTAQNELNEGLEARQAYKHNLEAEERHEGGDCMTITEKEKRVVNLLRSLEDEYEDLRKDLATIEGKKIGLPKMQKMVARLGVDGMTGIYRIRVKVSVGVGEEAVYKDYIGQAVNIKERWYEHCKKMIGADAKGGELLYSEVELPSACGGSVVEEVEKGNKAWLTERERGWIAYYGDLNRV